MVTKIRLIMLAMAMVIFISATVTCQEGEQEMVLPQSYIFEFDLSTLLVNSISFSQDYIIREIIATTANPTPVYDGWLDVEIAENKVIVHTDIHVFGMEMTGRPKLFIPLKAKDVLKATFIAGAAFHTNSIVFICERPGENQAYEGNEIRTNPPNKTPMQPSFRRNPAL